MPLRGLRRGGSFFSRWSLSHNPSQKICEKLKDQSMLINTLRALALSGAFIATTALSANITENFAQNPASDGWKIFGNTNLFHWDSTNHNIAVTWDSTQPNSYYYHPLGTSIDRNDDFTVDFDLYLNDIISGNEPDKTTALEIAVGFLNLSYATGPDYLRGEFGGAPNLVEFDYFYSGYYFYLGVSNFVNPTITPVFISTNSYDYAPTVYAPYEIEFPTNTTVHVSMSYTASSQTLATILTTNGQTFAHLQDVVLTDTSTSGFGTEDKYFVDTFAIINYSSSGDPYDSVLAHGSVANVSVTFPYPVQNYSGTKSNGVWTAQFLSRSNWLYTLQRTADFAAWTDVSPTFSGNGTNLFLQDTNVPADRAYYRVRANRP